MVLIYLFAVLATLFAAWRAWRRLRYFLHLFQLEGYKPNQYLRWLGGHLGHVVRLSHKVAVAVLALAASGFFFLSPFWTALLALPAWTVTFASSRLYRSDRPKKPLAYTNRLKRLLGAAVVFTLLPVVLG
ncbi:MAG: UDP-N-acetylmuramoyl-tripeptide--D-alanyl-D-alanine ligase, partial [Rhodothermales bacterium]